MSMRDIASDTPHLQLPRLVHNGLDCMGVEWGMARIPSRYHGVRKDNCTIPAQSYSTWDQNHRHHNHKALQLA